jgi:hypothetical protein
LLALVLCAALVPASPLPAGAASTTGPNLASNDLRTAPVSIAPAARYRMTLPLAGRLEVLSTFGAERDGGERDHKGIDLAAPRLTPVLAVRSGVVTRINRASVSVFLRHDDGWSSWYLHLNNDTYLTDDGLGGGVAPGLEVGDRVEAGQVIGWVGDSGNAEPTPPHLHFELRNPWGQPINPLRSLRAAAWVDETVPVDFEGAFWDDEEHEIAAIADLLASKALITGCGPYGLELCPDAELTAGDVEDLLGAVLGADIPVGEYLLFEPRPAPKRETFLANVELDEALGCGVWQYCQDQIISRGEMSSILAAVFEFEPTDADYFFDDEDHYAQDAINALAAGDVLDVCMALGPLPFEPDRPATRADLIDAIAKALDLAEVNSCRMLA